MTLMRILNLGEIQYDIKGKYPVVTRRRIFTPKASCVKCKGFCFSFAHPKLPQKHCYVFDRRKNGPRCWNSTGPKREYGVLPTFAATKVGKVKAPTRFLALEGQKHDYLAERAATPVIVKFWTRFFVTGGPLPSCAEFSEWL